MRSAERSSVPGATTAVSVVACLLLGLFGRMLVVDGRLRPSVLPFFFSRVLPVAAAHAGGFVLLQRLSRGSRRAALWWWAVSFALFLGLGGFGRAAALLGGLATVGVLILAGGRVARAVLPVSVRGPGLAMALGALLVSAIGSYLALIDAFRPAVFAVIATAGVLWSVRGLRARRAGGENDTVPEWSAGLAWTLELAFLLALFGVVAATAPESRADAVTRYVPYVRSLLHFRGFFDVPWQFWSILPQSGLTYTAALYGASPIVGRCAMLVAAAASAMIVVERGSRPRAGRWLVVLTLLSCPIVIWTSVSLYQESFVALAVLAAAVVCTEGDPPGSRRFWFVCGAVSGIAVCAKYSTVGFLIPLWLFAAWRSRGAGARQVLSRAAAWGIAGGGAVAAPWLVHAWRQSRNPLFPYLASIFPSPLWPGRIQERFGMPYFIKGDLRSLLLWPVDVTFHTDRFTEGLPGNAGLVVLVYLALALWSLPGSTAVRRVWLAAAAIGTAVVWTRSTALRFWLPALWLLGPSAGDGFARFAGKRSAAFVVSATLVLLVILQIPMSMIHAWNDPEGWPWRLYAGRMTEADYVNAMPGGAAIRRLGAIDSSWPKFWYTGFQAVAEADGIPLMAQTWELAYHVPLDSVSVRRYLALPGCRYWAVRRGMPSADLYRRAGFATDWWRPENLVLSEGDVDVYRAPGSPPAGPEAASPAAGAR